MCTASHRQCSRNKGIELQQERQRIRERAVGQRHAEGEFGVLLGSEEYQGLQC